MTSPRTTPSRKRGLKDHLVYVKTLKVALELGVDVRSLCGVWVKPFQPTERNIVPIVEGRPVQEVEPRNCVRCARIYDANAARQHRQRA